MDGPHGIHPVLYAFWDMDGRLDRAAMARQVDHCVAAGAYGIVVLGLVTEVHKLDVNERLALVETVGELVAGRVPYGVTIGEPGVQGQIAFARAARRMGATWVILQPPAIRGIGEDDVIRFFGIVADACDLPVAVQNNPVNLDVSLSVAGLVALHRQHPNVRILKGEGWSVDIARAIAESGGAYTVMGGHGGIEFPALLRAGGAGLIPAPDFLAAQVALYRLWRQGRVNEAEAIHRRLLPAIVFMSRSVPGMLCYGKRLFARQAGIAPVHDRAPALAPTGFGLSEIDRFLHEIATAVPAGKAAELQGG